MCQTSGLNLERLRVIYPTMTTSISANGQIILPSTLRKRKRIRPGDDFEVFEDEDDPSLIILRKVGSHPNAGLVDHLLACPVKGWFKPPRRRRERLRKARL
jgi:AbrB family looped-hinge helix DNA binding protein